jgi:hypothetical protein
MAFTSDVYRTQFASALKYHYPEQVMARLCFRKESILQYLNKIKAPGGGRQDMWGLNTYPADDSRAIAESTALITPTGEQFIDAYVTMKTRYTRRFISSAVLDDSKSDATALIKAASWYPREIANRHAFSIARNLWYTGGTYFGALGVCSTTSASTTINVKDTFNFRRIFRHMQFDVKAGATGSDVSNGGSLTLSEYSESNHTITFSEGTTISTTADTDVIAVEDEIYAGSYASYAWNSIPMLVGEGNVCGVTVSSYPEYKSKVYSSTGGLTLGKIQAAVDWVEGHSEGKLTALHTSPEVIIKYADLFLGDVRLTQGELASVKIGYPTKLAYRGGSMGLIPIEKDHLAPLDEIYLVNWDSIRFYNSAFMKWFDEDGTYLHRNQGYMEYELLFYSRGDLGIHNREGCAALTGILI